MLLFLACTTPPAPVAQPGEPALRSVELALDRGHFEDDAWVSEPSTDTLLAPPATQVGERAIASLALGDHTAVIRRACGPVAVPFSVTDDDTIVSLPYPRCPVISGEPGVDAPYRAWTIEDLARVHGIGLFTDWPLGLWIAPNDSVTFATFADAKAACAWYGRGLPAAVSAGDDAVWLADGTVAGGTWTAPTAFPPGARDHAVGVRCAPTRVPTP